MANLYLIGPQGAGKTTLGGHLARRLELPFVDQDAWFEAREGPIPTFLARWGRSLLTIRNARHLRSLLRDRDSQIIATSPTAVFNPYVPATMGYTLRWLTESGWLILVLPSASLEECRRLVYRRTRDRQRPPSQWWIEQLYRPEVLEHYHRAADLTVYTDQGMDAACAEIEGYLEATDDSEPDTPAD